VSILFIRGLKDSFEFSDSLIGISGEGGKDPMADRQAGRQCGNGSEKHQAATATVTHSRAGNAEEGVAPPSGSGADPEALAADRIADPGLAQVHTERSDVDGFAIEKAHDQWMRMKVEGSRSRL